MSLIFFDKSLRVQIILLPLHSQISNGTIAQLVEQRTENPCVTGSIPVGTTKSDNHLGVYRFFYSLSQHTAPLLGRVSWLRPQHFVN